jgi:Transposase DDE domain
MVKSISRALALLKRGEGPLHLPRVLDAGLVEEVFRRHKHAWRDRVLGPAQTLEYFVRQVIEGNVACAAVRHIAGGAFTASAYAQARSRLPVAAVWEVTRHATAQLCDVDAGRWHGHRTLLVDGTGFSMPDTPQLQEAFGQPGMQQPGCGFPVAHLLVLFDAASGMMLEAWPGPVRTHDLKDVGHVHEHLRKGDLLLGDDAFSSWGHLAALSAMGAHGVFPLHHCRTPMAGECFDRTQRWAKPKNRPVWMTSQQYEQLPQEITVRVVRRRIRRPGRPGKLTVTLVTTLLDRQKYPARELARLTATRWEAETDLRHLKITLKLDVLRCKTLDGVLRELAVVVLVYNLVRAVMLRAARRQQTSPQRVSFADTLAWLHRTGVDAQLYDLIINPLRPGRFEPRVVKRHNDKYTWMTRPRRALREALKKQARAA